MAALVGLYVKKAYADTPFFENAKIVVSLDDQEYMTPFGTKFADKMLVDGVLQSDVRSVAGLPVAYEDLMRLSIDYADAIVLASPTVNTRLYNYAFNSGKPILPYAEDNKEELMNFCNSLIPQE
jgi:starch synthase